MKIFINIFEKIMKILLDKVLGSIMVVLGILLCLIIWTQIFTRTFMSTPPTWTEEIARMTFMWFGTMAAAYTMWKKQHMAVDFIYLHFKGTTKLVVDCFIQICLIYLGFIMLKEGMGLIKILSVQKTSILRWPMASFYANIPISGSLYLLIGVLNLFKVFSGKEAKPVEASANQ